MTAKNMKALVKYESGIGKMELRDVPVPVPEYGEVLIKVKAVGICGTDLKIYNNTFTSYPPVIVGHEFSGEIVELGQGVKGWETGERVVSEQHTRACGICRFCLTGNRHLCHEKRSPGYGVDGAFAEFIKVPASLLHRIPGQISFEEATLIEPMAIAAQGILEKTGIRPEDFIVILGCGPVAILALQIAKAEGASKVIITGIDVDSKKRFDIARNLGADATINVMQNDPVAFVMNETRGVGADVVVDLSGSGAAIIQGLNMLRRDGRFCAMGLPHEDISLPWSKLTLKAANIFFSFSSGYNSWERCISMINNKKVKLNGFTENIFPLDKWEEAFNLAREGEVMKVIIKP
jgi:L-iditol 2-dehydrogenase